MVSEGRERASKRRKTVSEGSGWGGATHNINRSRQHSTYRSLQQLVLPLIQNFRLPSTFHSSLYVHLHQHSPHTPISHTSSSLCRVHFSHTSSSTELQSPPTLPPQASYPSHTSFFLIISFSNSLTSPFLPTSPPPPQSLVPHQLLREMVRWL